MEKLRIVALRTGLIPVLAASLWAQHGGAGHGGGGHVGGAGFAHFGAGHNGTGLGIGHSSSLGHGFAGFGAMEHGGVGHAGNFGFSRPGGGHVGIGFGFGQFPSHAVSGLGGFGHGTGFLDFGHAGHYYSYYPYSFYGLSFGSIPSYWPYPPVYPPAYPIVQAPVVILQGTGGNRPDVDTSIWLVALDGGLVRAVRKYWLEGEVFHYVLRDGTEGSMPLSEVYLSLTEQLNRERGLIFRLPKRGPESPAQIR